MKHTVAVILLTLLRCCVHAQPVLWDKNVLKANRIAQVSIHVQETNPAHPLVLKKEFLFDQEGRMTESLCKDCIQQLHRADHRVSADIIERYSYEKDKLLKIERKEFEESIDRFYYNKSRDRRLKITTDKNDKRIGLAFSHLDSRGRETLTYTISFADNVSQVFINKSVTKYESNKVITQTYGSNELVNMGQTIPVLAFNKLNSSIVPSDIENTLNNLDLSFLQLSHEEMTEITTDRIRTVDRETNKVKTNYTKDNKGLIVRGTEERGGGAIELVYQYTYRN